MLTFMDGLFVAIGFFGAVTLVWLVRRVVGLFASEPGVATHFGPDADEAIAREIGRARREVLLLGEAGTEVFAALDAAAGRKVALDVLLDPDADCPPFDGQKLQCRVASRPVSGLLVIVDDRVVIVGGSGQAVVVQGHPDAVQACRQRFAAHHPVSQSAAPAPVVTPSVAPEPSVEVLVATTPPVIAPPRFVAPASSPVDDLLAAVARGTAAPVQQEAAEEEEEDDAPPVTRATADLFARLRKEAASAEKAEATEEAA